MARLNSENTAGDMADPRAASMMWIVTRMRTTLQGWDRGRLHGRVRPEEGRLCGRVRLSPGGR